MNKKMIKKLYSDSVKTHDTAITKITTKITNINNQINIQNSQITGTGKNDLLF